MNPHSASNGLAHFGHRTGRVTLLRSQAYPQLPQIHCPSGSPDRTSCLSLLSTGDSLRLGAGDTLLTISACKPSWSSRPAAWSSS